MRNSKKLIAVIMTVALLASMMVPALAASYQTQADKLTAAGLMKGTTGTGLDTALTRAQGIEFTVRAMGKSAAAAALTDAEVTAALANVTDAATIPGWAKKSAAFAVSTKLSNGTKVSADGKITYSAMAPLSGKQFVTMMLRALGYTGITLDNCLDKAQMAGMLSASKVVAFGVKAQLTRDDAAYVIYETINNGLVADAAGITPTAVKLVNKLVADGALATTVAAANFTFTVATPAPAAALTYSAVAVNAKQFLLSFNQAVNADDGKDKALYTVKDKTIMDVTVQADGKSALLTLGGDEAFGNNSTADITVKSGFRNLAGTKTTADQKVSVTVFDNTFPTFDSVKAVGLKTVRLYFSEPVWGGVTSAAIATNLFEVKNSTYTWSVTKAVLNTLDKYVEVTLGTSMVEGTVTVTAKNGLVDYAGNKVAEKSIAYAFVKDATAPVASIKSASQSEVVVKFSKPVYGDIIVTHSVKGTYKAVVESFSKTEANATDEFTFDFSTNKLPGGTVTIYVAPVTDKTIQDLYGNKFVETALTATVTADTTAPTVSSTEKVANTSFKVTFNEALKKADAETIANYTLKKVSDGSSVSFSVTYSDKVVTITPYTPFTDATAYQLTIKKAVDMNGNATTADIIQTFTVGDNTRPFITSDSFAVNADGKIYIYYSEPMNATEMVKKANYLVASTGSVSYVSLGDNDSISAISDKIVLIDMNGAVTAPAVQVGSAVTDLDGKTLAVTEGDTALSLSVAKTAIGTENFQIDKAEAISTTKIKITFTKEVTGFNAGDLVVSAGAVTYVISGVESAGGKEAVIVLANAIRTDATTPGAQKVSVSAITAPSSIASIYGTKLTWGAVATVADKITPEVTKTGDDYNVKINIATVGGVVAKATPGYIDITYSEAMDWTTFSSLTYTVAGYDVTSVSKGAVEGAPADTFRIFIKASAANTTYTPAVKQETNVKDANANILASGTVYTSKYNGTY